MDDEKFNHVLNDLVHNKDDIEDLKDSIHDFYRKKC